MQAYITQVLNQIKEESKEKALHQGAYTGNALIAELQLIENKSLQVVINLVKPVYSKDYKIIGTTNKHVYSNFSLGSWRGSYDLPAASYVTDSNYTVQEIIDNLLDSDGEEVTGWKGGEFTLSMDDIIYVANYGSSNNSTAIVDIIEENGLVVCITQTDM